MLPSAFDCYGVSINKVRSAKNQRALIAIVKALAQARLFINHAFGVT